MISIIRIYNRIWSSNLLFGVNHKMCTINSVLYNVILKLNLELITIKYFFWVAHYIKSTPVYIPLLQLSCPLYKEYVSVHPFTSIHFPITISTDRRRHHWRNGRIVAQEDGFKPWSFLLHCSKIHGRSHRRGRLLRCLRRSATQRPHSQILRRLFPFRLFLRRDFPTPGNFLRRYSSVF